jgi:nucleotide-binding universal stress UspA family protein
VATDQQPIVVGVDGEARSLPAVRWAAREAAISGRELLLVHAMKPAVVLTPRGSGAAWPLTEPDLDLLAARAVFDAAEAEARACAPDVRLAAEAGSGVPAQVLLDAAAGADMVVVGTHGASMTSRAVLGSVSAELLARASCPVVMIRSGEDRPRRGDPVVVGVDGSTNSVVAAEFAAQVAERHGVPLHLVSAWRQSRIPGTGTWTQQRDPRARVLGAVRDDVRLRHPGVASRAELAEGSAAEVLVRASVRARLVVVGSRGHGAGVGLLLGSVSQTVARSAYCPVAVHHRPDIPPARGL